MTAQRNHYEVLGVPPTANTDQIKTKYRELARKFHPDVVKDKALGQKVFTQINQAYRVLADPERRAQYDAVLRSTGAPVGAAAPNGAAAPKAGAQAPSAAAALTPQQTAAVARLIGDADFALMNGDSAAALGHCEAALRIEPRNAKVLGLQGDALAAQKRTEEAAAAYRRSLQVQPSPMIQAKLARLDSSGARTEPPGGSAVRATTPGPNGRTPATGAAQKPPVQKPTAQKPPVQKPPTPQQPQAGGLFGMFRGKKK